MARPKIHSNPVKLTLYFSAPTKKKLLRLAKQRRRSASALVSELIEKSEKTLTIEVEPKELAHWKKAAKEHGFKDLDSLIRASTRRRANSDQ